MNAMTWRLNRGQVQISAAAFAALTVLLITGIDRICRYCERISGPGH
jgi:hypothetical protein